MKSTVCPICDRRITSRYYWPHQRIPLGESGHEYHTTCLREWIAFDPCCIVCGGRLDEESCDRIEKYYLWVLARKLYVRA